MKASKRARYRAAVRAMVASGKGFSAAGAPMPGSASDRGWVELEAGYRLGEHKRRPGRMGFKRRGGRPLTFESLARAVVARKVVSSAELGSMADPALDRVAVGGRGPEWPVPIPH